MKRLEQDDPLAGRKVSWFQNWGALPSVRGLEHIHVLVKDAPGSINEERTGEKQLE